MKAFLLILCLCFAGNRLALAQGIDARDRAQAVYDRIKGSDPVNTDRALTDRYRRADRGVASGAALPSSPRATAATETAPRRAPTAVAASREKRRAVRRKGTAKRAPSPDRAAPAAGGEAAPAERGRTLDKVREESVARPATTMALPSSPR